MLLISVGCSLGLAAYALTRFIPPRPYGLADDYRVFFAAARLLGGGHSPYDLGKLQAVEQLAQMCIRDSNGPEHLLELRQLQARIGTQAGARTHVDTAFDLATGPSLLNPLFGRLTVSWHPEELRITDPETVVAYLRSLPGPRLSSRHAGAARESVAKEIEREGA